MAQKLVKLTSVDVESAKSDWYRDLQKNMNNFSYWFPKIENCGISVPESGVIPVPQEVMDSFFMEHSGDEDRIETWVRESVMPEIEDMSSLLFIKNGCFSNKFNFSTCTPTKMASDIVRCVISINYASLCLETSGNAEMVFRKRVGICDEHECYHIYSGMPLRPEFRVFYDFDRKRVLYCVNYWSWDYCHDSISRDRTDKVVYEAAYPEIEKYYEEHRTEVEALVGEHMAGVSGLHGIWSVDLMWCENKYWLIDMAMGQTSAYYDPEKCGIVG